MMLGLGSQPTTLTVAVKQPLLCPAGSILSGQRDTNNICDFPSYEEKQAYLDREYQKVRSKYIMLAAGAALLLLLFVGGGK